MPNFIVLTVDHDEPRAFVEFAKARSSEAALETVLTHRDYCCHGVAYTAAELREFADGSEEFSIVGLLAVRQVGQVRTDARRAPRFLQRLRGAGSAPEETQGTECHGQLPQDTVCAGAVTAGHERSFHDVGQPESASARRQP